MITKRNVSIFSKSVLLCIITILLSSSMCKKAKSKLGNLTIRPKRIEIGSGISEINMSYFADNSEIPSDINNRWSEMHAIVYVRYRQGKHFDENDDHWYWYNRIMSHATDTPQDQDPPKKNVNNYVWAKNGSAFWTNTPVWDGTLQWNRDGERIVADGQIVVKVGFRLGIDLLDSGAPKFIKYSDGDGHTFKAWKTKNITIKENLGPRIELVNNSPSHSFAFGNPYRLTVYAWAYEPGGHTITLCFKNGTGINKICYLKLNDYVTPEYKPYTIDIEYYNPTLSGSYEIVAYYDSEPQKLEQSNTTSVHFTPYSPGPTAYIQVDKFKGQNPLKNGDGQIKNGFTALGHNLGIWYDQNEYPTSDIVDEWGCLAYLKSEGFLDKDEIDFFCYKYKNEFKDGDRKYESSLYLAGVNEIVDIMDEGIIDRTQTKDVAYTIWPFTKLASGTVVSVSKNVSQKKVLHELGKQVSLPNNPSGHHLQCCMWDGDSKTTNEVTYYLTDNPHFCSKCVEIANTSGL